MLMLIVMLRIDDGSGLRVLLVTVARAGVV